MKIKTGIEKLGKGIILLIFSIFTIFPFIWMILSALKTKAEIMDVGAFFPAEFQWHNFYQVIFESPLLQYVGNSLFVSVITLVLQIVTGAMIAYAIVFMDFKGKEDAVCSDYGNVYAPNGSNLYSKLYYSGKLGSSEYIYRVNYFKLCEYIWNFSIKAGFYAGTDGTD